MYHLKSPQVENRWFNFKQDKFHFFKLRFVVFSIVDELNAIYILRIPGGPPPASSNGDEIVNARKVY